MLVAMLTQVGDKIKLPRWLLAARDRVTFFLRRQLGRVTRRLAPIGRFIGHLVGAVICGTIAGFAIALDAYGLGLVAGHPLPARQLFTVCVAAGASAYPFWRCRARFNLLSFIWQVLFRTAVALQALWEMALGVVAAAFGVGLCYVLWFYAKTAPTIGWPLFAFVAGMTFVGFVKMLMVVGNALSIIAEREA